MTAAPTSAPTGTGSTTTRVLGACALVTLGFTVASALWWTEPDDLMGEYVRLFYLHVPLAVLEYAAFLIAGYGSVLYLWKRSVFGDLLAHAAVEVGVLYAGLTLVTGAIWGRPTWGTYWDWGDVRLVTTLILFLTFVGYLALRQVPGDERVRSKQAAIVCLIGLINIPIVNRSVEWWENRTLHQKSTLVGREIEDLNAFTTFLGFTAFGLLLAWFVIHRFRVAWLEREASRSGLDVALDERRAEAVGVVAEEDER